MTYCSGYNYEIYNRFTGSLFDTGYSGILIFFIQKSDINKILKLQENYLGKNIQYQICEPKFHVQSYRYVLYNDYLKNNNIEYDYVLICDSRDVLFQKNIENFDYDKNIDLYFFREDLIIKNCPDWNSMWLQEIDKFLKREKVYESLKDKYVICSGTTLGTLKGIKIYLNTFVRYLNLFPEMHILKMRPSDQGLHIYLYYFNKFKNINIALMTNENNLINTIGTCYRNFVKEIKNNLIINSNDDIAYVVHQYDRMPIELKKMFSGKYDFCMHR
jgi:hypothetical protein